MFYVMVAGIPHDIAFGVCHIGYKGVPYHITMWYDFWLCGMFFDNVCFLKTTENFNLGYLKVRND